MNFQGFTMVWMGLLICPRPKGCPLEIDCTYIFIFKIKFHQTHISFIFSYALELSVKSCPVRLDPLFDASSPPGCCPQSHEILLNEGMKYWDHGLNARSTQSHEILLNTGMKYEDHGLNARSTRTFIITVHIGAAVIGWRRSGKKRTVQTQFSTKFAAKLSFMPRWSLVYPFPLFFEISSTMWPTGGSGPVFSWLSG
jgi:hypothetical protein